MTISTNPEPTIYRNLYENTGSDDKAQQTQDSQFVPWQSGAEHAILAVT